MTSPEIYKLDTKGKTRTWRQEIDGARHRTIAGIKGTRERAAELLHEKHKFATVRFFEYTPDGIPRFPVAVDFHEVERTT